MNLEYLFFDEILDKYNENVKKKAPKKKYTWLEILLNIFLVASGAAILGGTMYFTYKKDSVGELNLLKNVFIFIVFVIVVNEMVYLCQRKARQERYRERLNLLKDVLKENGWDTEKKVELLIQWCDSYSRMESPWFNGLESLVKVFTVCTLPIISIAFQVIYEAEKEQQAEWLVMALLIGMFGGIVAFVVYPGIKSGLNGKGRLAESMKTDLKHIQLADSLGTKNPETEPAALQAAAQENGEENE